MRGFWTIGLLFLTVLMQGCGKDASDSVRGTSDVLFSEITLAAGLGEFRHETGAQGDVWFPETMGSGGAFIDFDGDGFVDILLVSGAPWADDHDVPAVRLFRNRGNGSFEDVTGESGLSETRAYGMGITVADYDGDGDADFYLTAVGANTLFRNNDGVFRDVTYEAGVAGDSVWSTAAVFFDANRDGWLDLLVGNYVAWSPQTDIPCPRETGEKAYCTPEMYDGIGPAYFENSGDGTFVERTTEAGFDVSPGKTLGMVAVDFDLDGLVDVAFANDTEADELYRNQGDGTFSEIGLLAGIAFDERGKARAGMGIDAGDLHNDGRISILVGNFASEMISVFTYREEGLFEDQSGVSGIGVPSLAALTFGLFLADVDLDGDLDVLAANGHIDPEVERFRDNVSFRQPVHLFLNDGGGRFTDVVFEANSNDALRTPIVGRGAAYADIDLDGDVDVLLTENGGPARLWRNETRSATSGPGFVRVRLEGHPPNTEAIGARIDAYVGSSWQSRQIRAGGSYLSDSERTQTFGLGGHGVIDSLRVTWPSGAVSRHAGVGREQVIILSEPRRRGE